MLPPTGFPVAGAEVGDLRHELRWYLEQFLDYPFPPATERAKAAEDALKAWGRQAFDALFSAGRARDLYRDARGTDDKLLRLLILADDPLVLAWPWEALCDESGTTLAHHCQIERQLANVDDPDPLPETLPTDRVNILLVTARPFEKDVRYRSISRPLVKMVADERLPAEVTLLRPPTLSRLEQTLRDKPGYFHVVHFDGHGGYGEIAHDADQASKLEDAVNPYQLRGPQGCLIFETDDGKPHPVPAATLSAMLAEHRIPAVVLNACQSATLDEHAEDAFASVAASLLRARVRAVVAMSYSLFVSGAQQFLPAFYDELFRSGDLASPTRAGRKAMLANPGRVCARGKFPLSDWIVPVVYQQQAADLKFLTGRPAVASNPSAASPELPEEARDPNPYGVIGRDGEILRLERAMHGRTPTVLIHGLGGVGKTTLARGFLKWMQQTNGLVRDPIWKSFHDVRSAEHVLNDIGTKLAGPNFITLPAEQKVAWLGKALREHPFVIVWDNFESVCGNESAGIAPLMPSEDRDVLRDLLRALDGGRTKVIITSRSEEGWLPREIRRKLRLAGLDGEERWEFCTEILQGLGVKVDRDDSDLTDLMNWLNGHPLLMRAILTRLEDQSPAAVLNDLKTRFAELADDDESLQKVHATLAFVEQGLPEDVRPLLVPLALHERFADADYLEHMAKQATQESLTRPVIDRFFAALATAGLVRDHGNAIYELHPALSSYLQCTVLATAKPVTRESWVRAFVEVMSSLANKLSPRPLHEQRIAFFLHEANFHTALRYAERNQLDEHFVAIAQSLAFYAQHTRSFDEAERLFEQFAERSRASSKPEWEAGAYHQLGVIAEERRQFDQAEEWYLKSLAIEVERGNEHGAALSYHELGRLAQVRRQIDEAEQWYLKALAIKKKQNDEHGAASTYHQLGRISQERREFGRAEEWYLKSLAIEEKRGNEHGAAISYHQLGRLAQERRQFGQAEQWYRKSLAIKVKQKDEHSAATTYHQLGTICYHRRQLDQAEQWYLKSLAIMEKQNDEHGAAISYHQLGMIAQERRQFEQAEQWYLKSLAIAEKQNDGHSAAISYHQLGRLAQERRQFEQAEQWHLKALAITEEQGNEHDLAYSYAQLALLAAARNHNHQAAQWVVKAAVGFRNTSDPHSLAQAIHLFATICAAVGEAERAGLRRLWDEAGLPAMGADAGTEDKTSEE